jgi:hypothetical protein
VAELGTIAHSGTREFMQTLKDASQKDKPGGGSTSSDRGRLFSGNGSRTAIWSSNGSTDTWRIPAWRVPTVSRGDGRPTSTPFATSSSRKRIRGWLPF